MRALTVCIGAGLLVAILCVSGGAQTAPAINGPSLGFVADKEGTTIWPLLGILGASVPGPPLVLPQEIRDAVISPRHDYALAIAGTNAQVVLVDLTPVNPTVRVNLTRAAESDFSAWYRSSSSSLFGSAFGFDQGFNVAGETSAIEAVTITLQNAQGITTSARVPFTGT